MRDQGITQYLGIDFSETAIALARQRSPCFGFIVADVRTTDVFARSHYDVIVCTEVLEHIADDLGLISRFRPGTRCICSVPSFPYESHLRHFRIADEVLGRYSALFDGLDVMTIPAPNETDARFFILDGIRTHTAISVTRQLRGDDERAG
jgi:SAM-dependent methyltransferase